MLNNNSIGIMQGRLSNKLGALQSFPWEDWRQEFLRASSIGFNQIEWLVDGDSVSKNPISTIEGRKEIAKLQATHKVSIKSLCAHIFIDGGLLDSGANYIKAKTNFLKILEELRLSLVCFFKNPVGSKIGILKTFIESLTASFNLSSTMGYLGFRAVKTVISQSFLLR